MKKTSYLPVIAIALLATLFTGCALIELIVDLLNYEYFCDGGTPKDGTTTDRNDRHRCVSCDNTTDRLINNRCYPGVYICDNGTPSGGVPQSADNDHSCMTCNSGYVLVNNRCVEPTFTKEPTVNGSATLNGASISVTTSVDAKMWWVVYADDTTIPDADTLITDASGSGGIQRSGAAGIDVTGGTSFSFSISNLDPETDYDLYVAIQAMHADGTPIRVLSNKRDVTTAPANAPQFTEELRITNSAQTTVTINYQVNEDVDSYWALYTTAPSSLTAMQLEEIINNPNKPSALSHFGSKTEILANTSVDVVITGLTAKATYYFYALIKDDDDNLVLSPPLKFTVAGYKYMCANGTEAEDTIDEEGITSCQSCDNYFKLEDITDTDRKRCVATVYTCTGGTKADGSPNATDDPDVADKNIDIEKCTACDNADNIINDGACEQLTLTVAIADGSLSANGAILNATASHNATLQWVVYASPATAPNAATLISNATDASAGVARSGDDSVSLVAKSAGTATISGLTATTDYDLYAVITAGDVSVISSAVDFTTTASGVISFTGLPTPADVAQTEVDINLTANEAANIYWVLYDDEQTLDNDELIAAAKTTDAGVARSGDGATIVASVQETIEFTNLQPLEDYFFYVLIEDADNNQRESNVHFTTTGYDYSCDNGEPVDPMVEQSDMQNAKKCTPGGCDAGYHFVSADNTCAINAYICMNGEPAPSSDSDRPDDHNVEAKCAVDMCDAGYHFVSADSTCALNQFTCAEGTAVVVTEASNAPTSHNTIENCASCTGAFWLDGANNSCTAHGTFSTVDATDTYRVADNGVTIECPALNVGDSFTIDGTEYTKRTTTGDDPMATDPITTANAATSCTTGVDDMSELFEPESESTFNQNISHWDVSDVTNMKDMFRNASMFDQDIGDWDVSKVTDMSYMFNGATAFNQYIGDWDVSMVSNVRNMFDGATSFNKDIGDWDVSKVTNSNQMVSMFFNATSFNQDLSEWCVKDIASTPSLFFIGSPIMSVSAHLPKWGDGSPNSCPINFTSQPAIVGDAAPSTTIKLKPSKDGDLYWIVYADNPVTFTNSAAVKSAANDPNEGFDRGNDEVMDNTDKVITINNLVENRTYYFYAALEVEIDGVTESEVANELEISVPYGDDDSDGILNNLDVDDDNDGLIEIATLEQLHNMRFNLAGTSYKTSAADSGDTTGARTTEPAICDDMDGSTTIALCGYELVADLSFDTDGEDDGTWSVSGTTYTLDSGDDNEDYFDVENGGWDPIGFNDVFMPNPFNAVFEGNNHTITGLAIERAKNDIGLFGYVGGATIQNLTIQDSLAINTHTTDGVSVGIVAGTLESATVSNVHITGTSHVVGSNHNDSIGALAGTVAPLTTVSGSSSSADVFGNIGVDRAGGLVGYNDSGSITASFASGNIDGGAGIDSVGGLVGLQFTGSISASYASGAVDGGDGGVSGDNEAVGGLVGLNESGGTVTASFATGTINGGNGSDAVGGLVGHHKGGTIVANYATGNVNGNDGDDYIGGLVGYQSGGSIIANYARNALNGGNDNDSIGGLLGFQVDDSAVVHNGYTDVTIDGGAGTNDSAGLFLGRYFKGLIHTYYGYGALNNYDMTALSPSNVAPDQMVPSDASGLTSDHFTGTESSHAWSFSSGEAPKLLYADYDGAGTSYTCTDVTLSVGGSDIMLTCGTSPLPGQMTSSSSPSF